MHDNGIEELITKLYDMVQDARSLPLGADKCIVERDKVLDMLDEISNQLPGELKQAKTIVDSRNELIAKAKREAEELVSQEATYKEAQAHAEEMIRTAQAKIKELKQVTNDYVDDSLKRTEEAIAEALGEIRESRSRFRKLVSPQERAASPIIEDV